MNDQIRDLQDEVEMTAGARQKQEVIGPTDALSKSALDVGLLRMELDASMEHALRHRRNMDVVVEQIERMALYNDASANRCIYALPRAEKAIVGPSIGLATIIATAWGNCNDGGWWIRTDRTEKVVVCGGTFFDLQTNRRTGATVTRRISGKSGRIYSDDMIAVTIQAATAIAQRNAILKGVPSPIWRPIYERALVVVRGTEQTLPERRAAMIGAFAQFGIDAKRIFLALGVEKEKDITLDQMVMLRGMYEQLRDEQVTAEEMFDPRRMTGRGFEVVENPLGDQAEDLTEGMTDDAAEPVQTEAAQSAQTAAGSAKAQPAAKQQAPAKDELPLNSSAQGPAKTEAKSEPKAEPKPEPKPPADAEAYIAHWRTFCASATSAAQVKNQYSAERQLRKNCEPITSDQHEEITQLKDERMAQLSGK
jgi:hypothetical protein